MSGEALKTLVADFNRDWPRCHAHAPDFCSGGGVCGRVIPPRCTAQRNPPFADDKRRAAPEPVIGPGLCADPLGPTRLSCSDRAIC
jgi:hypothetical protein